MINHVLQFSLTGGSQARHEEYLEGGKYRLQVAGSSFTGTANVMGTVTQYENGITAASINVSPSPITVDGNYDFECGPGLLGVEVYASGSDLASGQVYLIKLS